MGVSEEVAGAGAGAPPQAFAITLGGSGGGENQKRRQVGAGLGRGGELRHALGPDLETSREESMHQQTGKNNPVPKERLSSRDATRFTPED